VSERRKKMAQAVKRMKKSQKQVKIIF